MLQLNISHHKSYPANVQAINGTYIGFFLSFFYKFYYFLFFYPISSSVSFFYVLQIIKLGIRHYRISHLEMPLLTSWHKWQTYNDNCFLYIFIILLKVLSYQSFLPLCTCHFSFLGLGFFRLTRPSGTFRGRFGFRFTSIHNLIYIPFVLIFFHVFTAIIR